MIYSSSWICRGMLAVILLVLAVFVQAQTVFNLQSLTDSATAFLPLLKQRESQINGAKSIITDTKHSFLPQLRAAEQLNLGTDNSLAGSYYGFGITPSTSAGVRAENNYQAASGNLAVLYGEYELFNFGLNDARLKNAEVNLDLQKADLAREEYLVQLEVARNYFQLLRQLYRLAADQQNVERNQAIFAIILALTQSGIQPGADSSQAKAELSKSRISYNQTLGRIAQLKQQLSYLTGIIPSALIIDSLSSSSIKSLSAVPDFKMDSLNNPLLNYFNSRKNIFVSSERLIKKTYLPKLFLVGAGWARGSSIQYNDQYKSLPTGWGYQRFNYSVGLAITYNFLNGISRNDKLSINRYQIEASEYAVQQQKLTLASSVSQADESLQVIRANLIELNIQSESALATYNQKLAQYRAGLITLIDLSNASFVLYRSQTDFIETLHEWWLAQLDKAAATGHLNQFIQNVK